MALNTSKASPGDENAVTRLHDLLMTQASMAAILDRTPLGDTYKQERDEITRSLQRGAARIFDASKYLLDVSHQLPPNESSVMQSAKQPDEAVAAAHSLIIKLHQLQEHQLVQEAYQLSPKNRLRAMIRSALESDLKEHSHADDDVYMVWWTAFLMFQRSSGDEPSYLYSKALYKVLVSIMNGKEHLSGRIDYMLAILRPFDEDDEDSDGTWTAKMKAGLTAMACGGASQALKNAIKECLMSKTFDSTALEPFDPETKWLKRYRENAKGILQSEESAAFAEQAWRDEWQGEWPYFRDFIETYRYKVHGVFDLASRIANSLEPHSVPWSLWMPEEMFKLDSIKPDFDESRLDEKVLDGMLPDEPDIEESAFTANRNYAVSYADLSETSSDGDDGECGDEGDGQSVGEETDDRDTGGLRDSASQSSESGVAI